MYGGIDLGGTKIETCLFDEQLRPIKKQRVATPRSSYEDLLATLQAQSQWLEAESSNPLIPIGVGIPGVIDRQTGLLACANLVASGQPFQADLEARLGRPIVVENDCQCFTLSEVHGGAAENHELVFGLIIGTGVGGGVCFRQSLLATFNGMAGEVGHFALPAHLVSQWSLPLIPCGCGKLGCYETLVAGPGILRLSQHFTGHAVEAPVMVQLAQAGHEDYQRVYEVWIGLLCELLKTIQLVLDPHCMVLGGGVSQIEGLSERLRQSLPHHQLAGVQVPAISTAKFGDSSGVRGAAILARQRLQTVA